MHEAHGFLQSLAVVLCVAAVTTVVFQRLRQPVVLGYLLAGMAVGLKVPVAITADSETIRSLAELGVILLMFSLGIEFSLSKLLCLGKTVGFIAIVECSFMLWLGYMLGQFLGWSWLASIYAGAIIAISSTTVIVKAFDEQRIRGDFMEVVFGILIFEDLIAILLIALLTALSWGGELPPIEVARTAGRLAAFLAALLVVGLLVVPRGVRFVVRMARPETIVVASVGLAFGFAMLASSFGYSVALGAFLAGALVAESGVGATIESHVQPVRDIFVAIFFVSVGMLIDPVQIAAHWQVVLVFLVALVLGKVCAITMSTFLTGQSVQSSVKTGMSMAQIGEFSFILAGVGLASGATDGVLYSVAVAVSGITTLLTPWLIRAASPAAAWADRKLPRRLQTFAALYASWLEQLRTRSADTQSARFRRAIRWIVADAVVVAAVVIGASVEMDRIAILAEARLGLSEGATRVLIIAGAAALTAPFWIGLVRMARYIGFELAGLAFPAAAREQLDLAAAPRRLLIVMLQLAIVLAIGVPLIALTQPFLPPFRGAAVLLFVILLLAVAFWRGAANLQGHTRAAAEALAESLARQTRAGRASGGRQMLVDTNRLLAGLGSPVPVNVEPATLAVGKTLAQIELRGLTGATVLAIQRGEESVLVPSGHERLQAGDVLAIAGTHDAIEAARNLLAARDHDKAPRDRPSPGAEAGV